MKKKMYLVLGAIVVILSLIALRAVWQPGALFLRKYIFVELIVGGIIAFCIYKFRSYEHPKQRAVMLLTILFHLYCLVLAVGFDALGNWWIWGALIASAVLAVAHAAIGNWQNIGQRVGIGVVLGLYFVMWCYAATVYTTLQGYYTFHAIDKEELSMLPLTRNERVHPKNNITTMAYEAIGETSEPSNPNLVRVGNTNKWTMAVQPASENKYLWQRMESDVVEIFAVPSTTPFVPFTGKNRAEVCFPTAESMIFSKNAHTAVVKAFNPWQFLNYEASQIYYLQDDAGEWVQVVSLVRWDGFFFPIPHFGGVVVLRQCPQATNGVLRSLLGDGEFISADNISTYPYLTGQNLIAETISRTYAESFTYLYGLKDQLPMYRKNQVKIPDLPDDQNTQPFVTDFDFTGIRNIGSGLYHYFGLEPIDVERTALTLSIFVSADGQGKVYYYNHAARKEGLAGVSAMPEKVKSSNKVIDWDASRPVEHRPVIKQVGAGRKFFWLSTVVSMSTDTINGKTRRMDGASTVDLALVDAQDKNVLWLPVTDPAIWNDTISATFHSLDQ